MLYPLMSSRTPHHVRTPYHITVVSEIKGLWGRSRKKIRPQGGSSTQRALIGQHFDRFAWKGSPSQQKNFHLHRKGVR